MQALKNGYLLLGGFVLVLLLIGSYAYIDLKKQYILENTKTKEDIIAQVVNIAQQSSVDFELEIFENKIEALIQNTNLSGAKLEYTNFRFTDETIYSKIATLDKSWKIIDVTTDILSGQIINPIDGEYLFAPAQRFDFTKPVLVKFQAAKQRFIKDYIMEIPLSVQIGPVNQNNMIEQSRYKLYYSISEFDTTTKLNEIFIRFTLILLLTLLLLGVVLYFFYSKVVSKKIYAPVGQIDKYIRNILNKNFQKPEELQFDQKELDSLLNSIVTLSKKFSQNVNELNLQRDMIEKKQYTDELTGLPNKKSFAKDIKQMFINNKPSYVVYVKFDKLGEFTKEHGGDTVNRLLEDYVKIVEDFFIKQREFDAKLYRFFGAEFAMLIYLEDAEQVRKIFEELINKTQVLEKSFYFFRNEIYYGGSPFDKYGTIDSLLQSAKEEYQEAYKTQNKFYQISDLSQQLEKNKELEKSVKDIIEREDFALQYVFDTYDFSTTPKLMMQEVTPMLIDMRTYEKLPIGVFISVAEKLELASEFDKVLIKKVLEQIEIGEIEHKVAVNLSVGSFASMRFITWLNSIMNYEMGAKKLVFVITAYSATQNFEQYKRFVDTIVEFEAQVMLKRFDLDEFSLEQLERIKPHYIRIGRDDCNDIIKDSTKQHKIKQVLLFADQFDIKILGDSVKNEIDIQTLERLGFYGTSK